MAGSLCISIDLELAWGIWDKPSHEYHERCAKLEGTIVERLVQIFERHEVAATWAIVGRLLERDDVASRTTAFGDRIWYAPALIERVAHAKTRQEIASHGHEHKYFGSTTREQLRADLAAARSVHQRHGLAFDSFVFPRNDVNHLDLLRDAGISVYRSVDDGWFIDVRDRFGRSAGRVANLLDKTLPIPPRSVKVSKHDDLVELPSSMLLFGRKGLRRVVHPSILVRKAMLGLDAAKRSGDTFHLWFHPSNFYYESEQQFEALERIVAYAARMRANHELDIRTMGSFAA